MSIRVIVLFSLASISLACSESDDTQGSAGIGGAAGQLSGGSGAGAESGGASGAGGASATGGGGGAGGAAGVMSTGSGGASAGAGGVGGGGGEAGVGSAGGEAAAGSGGSGEGGMAGESGMGGESGTGSLQEDLGPCCETHEGPGCQDQATAECVCAMIPSCCTESWDEACALMVTQKHCEPGVRSCVCGSGPEEWQLQDQCCMGDWSALCQSTAVQKCGAKDSCF